VLVASVLSCWQAPPPAAPASTGSPPNAIILHEPHDKLAGAAVGEVDRGGDVAVRLVQDGVHGLPSLAVASVRPGRLGAGVESLEHLLAAPDELADHRPHGGCIAPDGGEHAAIRAVRPPDDGGLAALRAVNEGGEDRGVLAASRAGQAPCGGVHDARQECDGAGVVLAALLAAQAPEVAGLRRGGRGSRSGSSWSMLLRLPVPAGPRDTRLLAAHRP
jgi:hypothetical protein